jgi:hypothetical protein
VLPPLALGVGLILVIIQIRRWLLVTHEIFGSRPGFWKLRTPPVAKADLDLDPDLEAFRARAHRETEI